MGHWSALPGSRPQVHSLQFHADHRAVRHTQRNALALKSRTSDGLELTLELSFQYKLVPETMHKMYTRFGVDFHSIFIKMAMDLLTSAATKHAARSFFVNRTLIGNMMEATLKSHFRQNAFVEVPLFQLQAVSLPTQFEAAIRETQVAEQKIKKVQAEQTTKIVEFKTGVIQAQRYVKVQEQQAEAVAESIRLRNMAEIQSFNASQSLAAEAFKGILSNFGGDQEKLLAYMKVRAVRDHPASNSILGIRDDADVLRQHDRKLSDFNSGDL